MSNSEASSSGRRDVVEEDPLPRKPGELGYDPAIHGVTPSSGRRLSSESMPLGPHPAERSDSLNPDTVDEPRDSADSTRTSEPGHSRQSTSTSESAVPLASTTARLTLSSQHPQAVESSTSLAGSAASISSLKRVTKKLTPSSKPSKRFFGMAPRTLCKLFLLFFFLSGVCAGWGLATKANAQANGSLFGGAGMNVGVFIHVAFSVIVLTSLLFVERTIFRLRAERFSYLHPEIEMPSRNPLSRGGVSGLAFAPWHRPSLPTYAAALRGSPTATGDAEDPEVARMVALGHGDVPPTYGNIRGSTLLAYGLGAGPLRPSSHSSQRTAASRPSFRTGGEGSPSRPVSYGHSQEIEDALRAQKLEETLGRLEASR